MIEKQQRLSGFKVHKRDLAVALDRTNGMTYQELAKKYKIKSSNLSRILSKPEIKDVLETSINHMVAMAPVAVNVHLETMQDKENKALSLKAAENVLKTTSVMPGNVANQTINNIVNVQNNNILSPELQKAMTGIFNNHDDDIIEAEIENVES